MKMDTDDNIRGSHIRSFFVAVAQKRPTTLDLRILYQLESNENDHELEAEGIHSWAGRT